MMVKEILQNELDNLNRDYAILENDYNNVMAELMAYKNRKCSCGKIATIFLCEKHFMEAVENQPPEKNGTTCCGDCGECPYETQAGKCKLGRNKE
jgi:hypothetical protein